MTALTDAELSTIRAVHRSEVDHPGWANAHRAVEQRGQLLAEVERLRAEHKQMQRALKAARPIVAHDIGSCRECEYDDPGLPCEGCDLAREAMRLIDEALGNG